MGRSQHIYVGPYAKVNKLAKTRIVKISCCNNDACENFEINTENNYCPICGNKIFSEEITRNYKFSSDSCLYENGFIDSLYAVRNGGFDFYEDYEIFLPNSFSKHQKIKTESTGEYSFTEMAKSDEIMEEFKEKYYKEWETLKEKGFLVEFKFGLIIHFT